MFLLFKEIAITEVLELISMLYSELLNAWRLSQTLLMDDRGASHISKKVAKNRYLIRSNRFVAAAGPNIA